MPATDIEWREWLSKAAPGTIVAVSTACAAYFKQRKPRHKLMQQKPPDSDHGGRLERLEEDFREYKSTQIEMHRENQDRMREIAFELRDQRRITTTILSKMANLP